MTNGSTTLAGIEIPSTDPIFLAVVAGIHIPLGIVCVVVGALAMLSKKQRGRHSTLGKVYFWSLLALFGSATFLSVMRWTEDYHLFIFGAVSFASASVGRMALRRRWLRVHLSGMGMSYILLLVAFYVDNGRQLPVWKVLPAFSYWLLPFAVGMPIIVWALLRHPVLNRDSKVLRHHLLGSACPKEAPPSLNIS
jgi:uncharacterized membrane protein